MKIKKFLISELKANSIQPEGRTDRVKELMESIKDYGQLSPIIVGEDNIIIDGHRRVESLKQLGRKDVWGISLNGEMKKKNINVTDAFTICNASTKNLRHKDYVRIYRKGGLVPSSLTNVFIYIASILGKTTMDKLFDKGFSPTTIQKLIGIGNRIGAANIKMFIMWAFNTKSVNQIFASVCRLNTEESESIKAKIIDAYNSNTQYL